ncbi:hypothetical protein [Clostridium massiliamazoniense]|uniref:hypothetical protein n=1 Tax=Clostridium massiliamazoniense TaxID=1347366 RepID=UPI0006D78E64|nr:hypothetical protein [Clostridium massiliamazoniense]
MKINREENQGNLSIIEKEFYLKEVAVDKFDSKDEDYLVIGDFLKENIKSYNIGFGIIDKESREITSSKKLDLMSNENIAIFIYNCTLDMSSILGKRIFLKNKKNEVIWVGKIRCIPSKCLKFTEHEVGECYICDRVVNKNTIENKEDVAIATLEGNDKIFSVLNIKCNGKADSEKKFKEVDNGIVEKENIVSTELKQYIGNRGEELILKIIKDIITEKSVVVRNIKKFDNTLDKYAKITISREETEITINQNNDTTTIISCGRGIIDLEKILMYTISK